MTRAAAKGWVPDRQDIIWIDFNPQAGHEMRDLHPILVISPLAFNVRTGLVIGLSMTTTAYNTSNPFACPWVPPAGAVPSRSATFCATNPRRLIGVRGTPSRTR